MQIFQDFGVNPILLLAQIVNFLIILFVLKKFLYKPVLKIMSDREKEVKKGIEDAQAAQLKLDDATQKEAEILKKASERADKLIEEAKAQAQTMKTQAEEDAKSGAERILTEGRERVAQESAETEERLTKNIGRIAITILEKSLVGIFGEKEQKTILKKAQLQLEKDRP